MVSQRTVLAQVCPRGNDHPCGHNLGASPRRSERRVSTETPERSIETMRFGRLLLSVVISSPNSTTDSTRLSNSSRRGQRKVAGGPRRGQRKVAGGPPPGVTQRPRGHPGFCLTPEWLHESHLWEWRRITRASVGKCRSSDVDLLVLRSPFMSLPVSWFSLWTARRAGPRSSPATPRVALSDRDRACPARSCCVESTHPRSRGSDR